MKRDEKGGGTNADGTQSTMYCSHCYQNGQFVLPNISVTEMQARVRDEIIEFGMPGFLAGILRARFQGWRADELDRPDAAVDLSGFEPNIILSESFVSPT